MEISQGCLEALQKLSTPTVSNAIELFDIRPRHEGFMSAEVGCLFPDLGVMVGYAATARFAARSPATNAASRYDFWKYISTFPEPRVVVMEDIDDPPGIGAYFGEVQSTIHKRLGCIGVVTNGCVRDLDEVHAIGFHYFAKGACVSHAYVHLVDFGGPVRVGGVTVNPGDLIHADKHGVLIVPKQCASEVTKAAAQVAEREQRIIEFCRSADFTLEGLRDLYEGR
jgi:4-hydroxy-4-methyl-2-oxoglutarate aldolase